MNPDTNSEDLKPSWLTRMQEQTWEPEILISGIVIFALFQIPPYIEIAVRYLDTYSYFPFSQGNIDDSLSALILVAIYWLIIGFSSHLLFRSIWAAFLGLSYLYPGGVRHDKLKFTSSFSRYVSRGNDYIKNIIALERICSAIFAISFYLFMSIIGGLLFLVVFTLILVAIILLFPEIESLEGLENFFLIPPILYFLDFVTLGALKRIPFLSKIYYPIYKIMSWITLAPLYRSIYYGFLSNHKKWQVLLFVFLFGGITVGMIHQFQSENEIFKAMELGDIEDDSLNLYHGHYQNIYTDKPSLRIQIEGDVITRNVLKVFLPHGSRFEEYHIKVLCNFDSIVEATPSVNLDSLKLNCLSRFYELKINGDKAPSNFLYSKNPKTDQQGLVNYLDIGGLSRGEHKVELYYNFPDSTAAPNPRKVATVEFFKDVPAISYASDYYEPDSDLTYDPTWNFIRDEKAIE